jgi:hypothetical protein
MKRLLIFMFSLLLIGLATNTVNANSQLIYSPDKIVLSQDNCFINATDVNIIEDLNINVAYDIIYMQTVYNKTVSISSVNFITDLKELNSLYLYMNYDIYMHYLFSPEDQSGINKRLLNKQHFRYKEKTVYFTDYIYIPNIGYSS